VVGDDDAVEFYEKRHVRGELPGPVLVVPCVSSFETVV
jgi:hypothetical protein